MIEMIAITIEKLARDIKKSIVACEDPIAGELLLIAAEIRTARVSPFRKLKMKMYYKTRKSRILHHMKKFYTRFKKMRKRPGGVSHHKRHSIGKHKSFYKPKTHLARPKRSKSLFHPVKSHKPRKHSTFHPIKMHKTKHKSLFKPIRTKKR